MPIDVKGYLIDLNGVVYEDFRAIPGAKETIEKLKINNIPFLFCTNTTVKSMDTLYDILMGMELAIEKTDIFSALSAARNYIAEQGRDISVSLVLNDDASKDFAEFQKDETKPDYIVFGEVSDQWSFPLLNKAFHQILNGAQMVACHKSRYWQDRGELRLSVGAFVSGLEYATDQKAVVLGKPTPEFYNLALKQLGLVAEDVAMVGDDINSDIGGAQAVGMKGILVKTGKYRKELVDKSDVEPDLVIDSIKDLLV